MVAMPRHRFGSGQQALVREQRKYSGAQREMAMGSPHLGWANARQGLPAKLRRKIWDQSDGLCSYCKCALSIESYTIDHISAVAAGGGDDEHNLCVACQPCNSSKGTRPI